MSLVEQALKKLQANGRPATPVVHRPAGVVVSEHRPAPPAQQGSAAAPRPQPAVEIPSRIVKIDREALRNMQLLPPVAWERQVASQYQHIKRPLVAGAVGRGGPKIPDGHLIMIASALPGEGKTFTSINLSLSLALEKDIELLLVDADVAKPHVSRIFGVDRERGLLDLLTDVNLHPDSVILRTDVPGLSILPAGHMMETATELLASERMNEVVAQLAGTDGRRIVLFDSPPLLLSTESRALLPHVGHVVLIAKAESTPQKAVMEAVAAIEAAGERPISLILNQSATRLSDGYYGYGTYGQGEKGAERSDT